MHTPKAIYSPIGEEREEGAADVRGWGKAIYRLIGGGIVLVF